MVSRRLLLGLGVGSALAWGLPPGRAAVAQDLRPVIHPRDDWGRGLVPTGTMPSEAPGEVKFLLVHHSETPNTEQRGSIPQRLRSFYRFHTTDKGWADVAYNFFVDPFGEIWEGRAGSLTGPVRGDATGGSQGYAQLCCFVGDHTAQAPTDPAMAAMTRLLAWLAVRYAIDLSAGHTISFVSRGSNRWPKGAPVTTDPIAGHRDMSLTECPGNALYPLVRSQLLPQARRLTAATSPVPTSTPAPSNPPVASSAELTPQHATANNSTPSATAETQSAGTRSGEFPALPAGAVGLAAGIGAVAVVRSRRRTPGAGAGRPNRACGRDDMTGRN